MKMNVTTEKEIMKNWISAKKPVVSVCCITFNHEKYIEQAIDSFLIQKTNFPFEIIIRDDCSKDETAVIIETYANKFPNIIKPIFESENQYSKGIKPMPVVFKKALGNYIALCEGDDYWTDPEKLQIQVDAMKGNPECYMSFHTVKHRVGNRLIDTPFKYKQTSQIETNSQPIHYYSTEEVIVHGGYYISTPSVMLDKRVVEEPPSIYINAPIGDYILKVLGSVNGGALFINRAMSAYRVFSEGSWSSTNDKDEDLRLDYCMKTIDFLDDMNNYLNNQFKTAINQRKSVYLYTLAGIHLNKNNYTIFREYIQQTFNTGNYRSHGVKFYYYLRNYPIILLYIKKFKKIFTKENG